MMMQGNIDPTEVISRFMEYVADDQITNVQKSKRHFWSFWCYDSKNIWQRLQI